DGDHVRSDREQGDASTERRPLIDVASVALRIEIHPQRQEILGRNFDGLQTREVHTQAALHVAGRGPEKAAQTKMPLHALGVVGPFGKAVDGEVDGCDCHGNSSSELGLKLWAFSARWKSARDGR